MYDKICEYVAKNPARFHMPAHFGTDDNPLFSSAKYDVTELDFSDNLQNPTGAILESEKECAKTYGAKNCFYLTSGSTTGVFIAMSAIRNRTDEIIVARSSHKSEIFLCHPESGSAPKQPVSLVPYNRNPFLLHRFS